MADILPTVLFPNYTSDGTNITIPIADLASLTASEADAATGDGRELARALVEQMFSSINALADTAKPAEFLMTKSNPQGQGVDTIRQTYSVSFDIVIDQTGVSLVAEA